MYNISTPLQNSTVFLDCYRMDWCDCNRIDRREHSIGSFVHNLMIDFKWGIFHIQIRSTNFPMVMCWVMFCEIIPHFLASWFPINKKVFLFFPAHPCRIVQSFLIANVWTGVIATVYISVSTALAHLCTIL